MTFFSGSYEYVLGSAVQANDTSVDALAALLLAKPTGGVLYKVSNGVYQWFKPVGSTYFSSGQALNN